MQRYKYMLLHIVYCGLMANQKLKEYLKLHPLSIEETNRIKEMFKILYPDVAEELMRDGNRGQFFTEAACVYEGFKGAWIYLEILPTRKATLKLDAKGD